MSHMPLDLCRISPVIKLLVSQFVFDFIDQSVERDYQLPSLLRLSYDRRQC
jgi:hypothetical protein